MDKQSLQSQQIISYSIYFMFIFSVAYLIGLAIDLEMGLLIQFLLIILISTLVKYIIFNPLIFYALLSFTFIIALLVNHYITPFLFSFIDKTYNLLLNIMNNLKGKERILEDNVLLFWVLLVAVISLFTAIILFKSKKIAALIPFYFSFYLYYWYNFYDQAFWMISIFLISYFILLGIMKYGNVTKNSSLNKDFDRLYSPWLQTTVRYAILIIIFSLLLPKNHNYIRWNWLQSKVYQAFPVVAELRSTNIYSRSAGEASAFNFSITGFQESSSRLGGPVQLNNKKIMTVEAKEKSYLRGNIKYKYTGNSWETENENWESYALMQDFSGITDEEIELFYSEEEIIVTNHNFASTTLFAPYLPKLVNIIEESWVSVNTEHSIKLSRGIYDNESYFVRTLKPLPYGVLLSLGIDNKKEDINNLDKYLHLPEDKITERTKSLVKEIVKGKNRDFEKAISIEDYLRNNFRYNLSVGEVPEGNEFVDYFLFEEQEGYCTYFATAMTIMLRLEGIPARYVEGFLAQDMVEKDLYEVRYEHAHSWVEAFIEPVGWMTFEATPEFPVEDRLEVYEQVVVEEVINEIKENIESNHPRDINDNPDMDFESEIGIGDWNIDRENAYEDLTTDLTIDGLFVILGIMLSIIPVKFLTGFIKVKVSDRNIRRLPNNTRIIYLYDQILKLINSIGYSQNYGETHYEFAKRIAYKFYDQSNMGIKEVTEIFVKSKYSKTIATDEEVIVLEKYKFGLEKRLKYHIGRRAYYFNKYFRLK